MELVDFTNLEKLSGGDKSYFGEVIKIFIDSTSQSIKKLQKLAQSDDNHLEVSSIAHSIKSGVGVVQITGMLEELIQVEKLAKDKNNMNEARKHLADAIALFNNALPILEKHR